jgi:cyclopropane fatty-acyl-phospholipid synthase-like methyltransferase
MGEVFPARLIWAVDMLAVAPSDRLLEIGCGYGSAVSLICSNLIDGTITAIDRSENRIKIAEKKNAKHIADGKANFISAPLHEVDLGQSQFNKIFAVNVNLFWKKAARELEMIKDRLFPGGAVYLINHPPAADKLCHIADCTAQNLLDAGFGIKAIVVEDKIPGICVIAEIGRAN